MKVLIFAKNGFMTQLCKMMISPGIFFLSLIFWVIRGVKEQTWSKIRKLLSYSVSLEPYIMWFLFMVHMCKMLISPHYFFIFSKFCFFELGGVGGKREKNGPKLEKILSVTLHISGTIHHDIHLWYTCVKEYLPMFFSFFQNFAFLGC